MRYLIPILFLVGAVFLAVYDLQHEDHLLVFPILGSLFPSLRSNPRELGLASAGVLAFFGLIGFAVRIFQARRDSRRYPGS
jgi:hypothetical protein